MTTLHIENTVRDYDAWKTAFDKFDRARRDGGVRSYRITRPPHDASLVMIDLEFDTTARAEQFAEFLRSVWRTPQSRDILAAHSEPIVLELVEDVSLA
jgi:hypothetical protein